MGLAKKLKTPVHGWLVLDKPIGITSTQALGRSRRVLDGKKVGHGGTLDPLATGILPLAFGEATKLIPYVVDGDKEYEFTICWGERRDTDDAEGKILATSGKRPTESEIRKILPQFIGTIDQTPPTFSAIKLEGKRAYDIARSGGSPEMVSRKVLIHALELTHIPDQHHAVFRVHCGKGMYVRALARDMAEKLGTCGFISGLRRTRVGPFALDQATSLEKLEELGKLGTASTVLLALHAGMGNVKTLHSSPAEAQRLRAGQGVLIRPQHGEMVENEIVFVMHQNVPVALTEVKAGELRVLRGFQF